jgi:CelD/BcsL family acetyltransferase involved in cellulose biosynthesis
LNALDHAVHIEVVREPEAFSRLKDAWERLCDELGDRVSAFASPAWYETWWRHFSAKAELNVMVMRKADTIVGIAPLMLRQATIHGVPVRLVDFIENRYSPHNDFIVLPAVAELFVREVLRVLFEQRAVSRWDIVVFNNMPATSVNYRNLIQALGESGRRWRQEPTLDSPCMLPSGSWTDYLAGRSPRTRKTLRNIQNRMHRAGSVTVRHIRTWEEFEQVREEVYSVEKRSWTGNFKVSVAVPENEAFFDSLARSAAAKGWLSLWTLHLDGKMIAFEFHLKSSGREHAMRASYLPEFAALSPGTYLEMQILKNFFDESNGAGLYDFGGAFDDYKRKWTDASVPHRAVSVFNDNLYSRFVALHESKTVPALKRIFPRNIWTHAVFRRLGLKPNRLDF